MPGTSSPAPPSESTIRAPLPAVQLLRRNVDSEQNWPFWSDTRTSQPIRSSSPASGGQELECTAKGLLAGHFCAGQHGFRQSLHYPPSRYSNMKTVSVPSVAIYDRDFIEVSIALPVILVGGEAERCGLYQDCLGLATESASSVTPSIVAISTATTRPLRH